MGYNKLTLKSRLVVEIEDGQEWRYHVADIYIDGRWLQDIIREVELPFATAEGHPSLAASYQSFPLEDIAHPSRILFGDPSSCSLTLSYGDGWVSVLIGMCCFITACWPFHVQIEETDREVLWKDYTNIHRDDEKSRASQWNYDKMPRFVFDKKELTKEWLRFSEKVEWQIKKDDFHGYRRNDS
ncbi:hypothetical protein K8R78_06200 [bacterium]|nr:hypothetical protein [bacterium]